ncbi:MAG TPA: nicotinate-nucleotide adenylyltransferase [Candidatus Blautia pullistercoris]|uniref:Probable nicotinate-nucleotide adenylyltransferase n=1 Tax=Candidatus Blautia pullistercoris TaxID=2838499 RepID=A0A9D1VNV3_9FIRM|nr:nicotinate-nucleotide adenylyltransferase [Clostridiales bacterium]HIX38499.1 nicotinate-nucleotide adenylyltransferase [Candidatus Blautia pullistercoris]
MSEKKKRIGIMGGTFDPIHIGHLILGETAYHQFHLDNVLFMPAGNPPHKQDRENRATDSQRVEMVRLAIASNPHFTLSMEEMHREGYSYTYRTLERLKKRYPDTEYYFILGADSLYTFDEWKEPARILGACTILVGTRNHTSDEKLDRVIEHLEEKYHGQIEKLESLNIDISSKMIRSWIEKGRSLAYYVPDQVIEYIQKNNIYKDCDEDEV